ncbi:MAG: hypothetical protein WAV07_14220 [Candidatus Contendobacter sp.]
MIEKIRLELLEILVELSEQRPEVRLGQLISNLATLAKGPQVEAIWDVEDRELLEAAKQQLAVFRSGVTSRALRLENQQVTKAKKR